MTSTAATFKVITLKDFDKICRTCLGEEQLGPIKDTLVSDLKVKELLEYTIMVEVNEADHLPQNICENCLISLYKMYEFKKLCQNNDTVLRVLLEKDPLEQIELKEEYPDVTLKEEHEEYKENSTGDPLEEDKEYKENSTEESNCVEVKNESIENVPKSYKCEDSDFTSPGKEERFAHCKQAQHGRFKRYKCDICGKRFSRSDHFHAHKKIHETKYECNPTNDIQFMCDVCGRAFKRPTSYHAHLETHKNSKEADKSEKKQSGDHLCEICGHASKDKYLLKQHKLIHGEKTFLCSTCGKAFVSSGTLMTHLKVHTDQRPYNCLVCEKSFRNLKCLSTHMLIHKGFKSYKCTECPKSFIVSSHLTRHLRTHSGEKPYMCTFCKKSFASKGSLQTHIRIHTGETPYKCPVCGEGFRVSTDMKRHLQTHNKAEQLEEAGPKKQAQLKRVMEEWDTYLKENFKIKAS